MASLNKIPAARGKAFEVRWRDPRTGRQHRRRYATRELANRALGEAIRVEGMNPAMRVEREATFGELVKKEAKVNTRRSSSKTHDSYLRNHVPAWFAERPARYLTIEDVEGVLQLAAPKLAESSVDKLRRTMSVVLQFGVNRGYCDINPCKGAVIPSNCKPSKRSKRVIGDELDPDLIPSPAQCAAIVGEIGPRFEAMVEVLYTIGLRLGEAVALDVADWHPDTTTIRVRRSGPHTTETKGARTFRDVDIHEELATVLDAHIALYCDAEGPLFPGPRQGRLTPSNFRQRYFYPAVDRALGPDAIGEEDMRVVRPNDLRHTAASLMITAGVSDIELANQLGHSSSVISRKVYAGLWRRQERQASAKMGALLRELKAMSD